MEAMRAEREILDPIDPSSVRGHGVGGFVELNVITSDAGGRWIMHTWPDEVGRPIDPFADIAAVRAA